MNILERYKITNDVQWYTLFRDRNTEKELKTIVYGSEYEEAANTSDAINAVIETAPEVQTWVEAQVAKGNCPTIEEINKRSLNIIKSGPIKAIVELIVWTAIGVGQSRAGRALNTSGKSTTMASRLVAEETAAVEETEIGAGARARPGNLGRTTFTELKEITKFLKTKGLNAAQRREVIEAFNSGAEIVKLDKDLVVYRYYGGAANPKGRWVTTEKLVDPVEELALPPGSTAENVTKWVIPKGTEVIKGTSARNFGRAGGAKQIFISNPSILKWVLNMNYNINSFLSELDLVTSEVKIELLDRKNGIPGNGSASQLEIIINELEQIRRQVQTNMLPPKDERYTAFSRYIVDEWDVNSILGDRLTKLADKYKRKL